MVARCQPHLAADAAGNTPSMSSPIDGQIWVLDQQGNWDQFVSDLDGASGGIDTYQVRDHSVANEITDIDKEPTFGPASSDWIDPTYDAAGNMTKRPDPDDADDASDADTITFDAWNRLVKISDATTGTVAIYYYDGLGRRIAKFVDGTHLYDYYYNESWQVVEVRKNGDEDPLEQFAYDINYIDALAIRWYDNDTDAEYDGDSGSDPTDNDDGEQYYLYDASFNVIALLDKAGTVLERYRYTPYGKRIVMNASFASPSGTSSYGQQRGFQGLLHDEESGLIYNRARMMDPLTGRFLQRDPMKYVDGMSLYPRYASMWGGLAGQSHVVCSALVRDWRDGVGWCIVGVAVCGGPFAV